MPTTPFKREFCRSLFEEADTIDARHALLTTLRNTAQKTLLEGRALVATAAEGSSATFQLLTGWSPDDTFALINEARAWADCADLTSALALINLRPIRAYRIDFSTETR